MSHAMPAEDAVPAQQEHQGVQPTTATAWVGWVFFAAFMMFLLGLFHAMAGLVALFRDEYFLVGRNGLVVNIDYTAWGWIHLLGGAVMAAAAIGLLSGRTWARAVAVVVALVSAVVNLGFLAAYPIWSAIMIAVDILVIWALIVHGAEMRDV